MKRKRIRTLAVAISAVFALTAIGGVAAASAASYHVEKAPALVEAEPTQELLFKLPSYDYYPNIDGFSCDGKLTEASSQVEFTVFQAPLSGHCRNYTGTGAGGEAYYNNNGCKFFLSAAGVFGLSCSEATNKYLELHYLFAACTIHIPPFFTRLAQENQGTGSNRQVKASVSASNLTYEAFGYDSHCRMGTHTDGEISGAWLVKAFEDIEGERGSRNGFWFG